MTASPCEKAGYRHVLDAVNDFDVVHLVRYECMMGIRFSVAGMDLEAQRHSGVETFVRLQKGSPER